MEEKKNARKERWQRWTWWMYMGREVGRPGGEITWTKSSILTCLVYLLATYYRNWSILLNNVFFFVFSHPFVSSIAMSIWFWSPVPNYTYLSYTNLVGTTTVQSILYRLRPLFPHFGYSTLKILNIDGDICRGNFPRAHIFLINTFSRKMFMTLARFRHTN